MIQVSPKTCVMRSVTVTASIKRFLGDPTKASLTTVAWRASQHTYIYMNIDTNMYIYINMYSNILYVYYIIYVHYIYYSILYF